MIKPFILLCLFVCYTACTSKPNQTSEDSRIADVERNLIPEVYIEGDSTWTITDRMAHYGVPGVSIAVIHEGKLAWSKTYGTTAKDSGTAVTQETLFQAGSISKPVAAYGALKMVEQNQLDLDNNVNTYLTSWTLPDTSFSKEKKVTLKHLLSHTGGITVHGFLGYSPGLPVPTLVQVLDGLPPANSAPIRVDKTPEESFRYSGGGYCIMQQMVVDVRQENYPQAMQALVLDPLDMKHSTYEQPLSEAWLVNAATGYLPDGSMTKGRRHTYPEMAAAGLWTNAEDLAKFALDVYDTYHGRSQKVLSQSMVKRMLTPLVTDFIGLGLFLEEHGGERYFGHGGWDEGFSSQMLVNYDRGNGVVILTNSNHPAFIDELLRSVAITYQWKDFVPQFKRQKSDSTTLARHAGRYRFGHGEIINAQIKNQGLWGKISGGEEQELVQITDSTFIVKNGPRPIQFSPDGQLLWIRDLQTDSILRVFVRMGEDEKLPFEWLEQGLYDEALKGYKLLKQQHPDDPAVDENQLNRQGYNLLNSKQEKLAQQIFKINTVLYPQSANVYDSYAESCYALKDYALALENYQKALAMNPKNDFARQMIKDIKGKLEPQ